MKLGAIRLHELPIEGNGIAIARNTKPVIVEVKHPRTHRETGIQVKVLPAPETSLDQLAFWEKLLSSRSNSPDVYGVDIIWPAALEDYLLGLKPYVGEEPTAHFRELVQVNGQVRKVNSYHCFAAFESRPPLDVWAVASDSAIEAIRRAIQPITGIMWHPERTIPFSPADVALFRQIFEVQVMRAVILAAGRGSRVGQLCNDKPKCLLEVEGKP